VHCVLAGQLLIVMVVPFKWLLRTHVQPLGTTPAAPKSSWQRFRHHLQQCLLDHPTVKTAAFLWTGTAIFNAWLRALGTKVGKQAWIGEVSVLQTCPADLCSSPLCTGAAGTL
jgi:hypothetical protein